MKKVFTLVLLCLIVATTLVTGTLAVYSVDAPELQSGDITAKNFVFVAEGTSSFNSSVKIAPTETFEKGFYVSNFDSSKRSETAMNVTIKVTLSGDINPLQIAVTCSDKNVEITQVSATEIVIKFAMSPEQEITKSFNIIVNWPSTSNDNAYMGKSSQITVEASAVQA
jgi:hypothetical protein